MQENANSTVSEPPVKRSLLRRLYDWMLHWADTRFGTPALAGISFAESSFFPIPPDPLLMALALGRPKRSIFYAFVCTVASVLGGLLGYAIGVYAMESIGVPIIEFYGKEDVFDELRETFLELGFWAVLVAAVTPVPYKVFTITAGACALSMETFILASVIGRSARFFGVGTLVFFFGAPVKEFIDRYFNLVCVLFVVLLIGGFVLVKWWLQ